MKTNKVNTVFSKENQKVLAEQYREGLKAVWNNDSKMVDFCIKSTALFVPICDGKYILNIEKERIQKDFWFGESDCGQGPSHEENNIIMQSVHDNLVDYFIRKNMSDIEDKIKQLKEIYNGKSCCQAMHGLHYYSCPEDSKLHGFRFFDKYRDYAGDTKLTEMTKKDLKLYIEAWQLYKEIFFKKLETYIKKYDLKHVGIHSYWIDR